jgi:hypothetical protein
MAQNYSVYGEEKTAATLPAPTAGKYLRRNNLGTAYEWVDTAGEGVLRFGHSATIPAGSSYLSPAVDFALAPQSGAGKEHIVASSGQTATQFVATHIPGVSSNPVMYELTRVHVGGDTEAVVGSVSVASNSPTLASVLISVVLTAGDRLRVRSVSETDSDAKNPRAAVVTGSTNATAIGKAEFTGVVQTTDDVPSLCGSFSASVGGTAYAVTVEVAAFNSTNDDGAVFVISSVFKNVANSVTQVGATRLVSGPETGSSLTGASVNFGIQGTTVEVSVTGLPSKVITWKTVGTYFNQKPF